MLMRQVSIPAVRIVTGPPAAGKSTFVRERRRHGDVVIDFDAIANALSGHDEDNHDHDQHITQITKAARQAAIDKALSQEGDHTVWIIQSMPSEALLAKYRDLGAVIDVVDPGKDIVMSRVKRQRPRAMMIAAAKWYDRSSPAAPPRRQTTTERGLGWEHQKIRDRLLAVHVDGTPCWWCRKPMYRDKRHNHDGLPLAADHKEARKHGGDRASRLLHFSCNSSRKEGENDDRRPAAAETVQKVVRDSPAPPPAAQAPASTPSASVFQWPDW